MPPDVVRQGGPETGRARPVRWPGTEYHAGAGQGGATGPPAGRATLSRVEEQPLGLPLVREGVAEERGWHVDQPRRGADAPLPQVHVGGAEALGVDEGHGRGEGRTGRKSRSATSPSSPGANTRPVASGRSTTTSRPGTATYVTTRRRTSSARTARTGESSAAVHPSEVPPRTVLVDQAPRERPQRGLAPRRDLRVSGGGACARDRRTPPGAPTLARTGPWISAGTRRAVGDGMGQEDDGIVVHGGRDPPHAAHGGTRRSGRDREDGGRAPRRSGRRRRRRRGTGGTPAGHPPDGPGRPSGRRVRDSLDTVGASTQGLTASRGSQAACPPIT